MSRYWEEFDVGARYPTYGRTITEGDLSLFCALVGYHAPLFIDEEYAKQTPYGGRIVPSPLTMERGRFLAPVWPGDTIRTEVEVVSKKETSDPSRGVVVFRDHVLNQRDEVVFEIDKITLIKRQ